MASVAFPSPGHQLTNPTGCGSQAPCATIAPQVKRLPMQHNRKITEKSFISFLCSQSLLTHASGDQRAKPLRLVERARNAGYFDFAVESIISRKLVRNGSLRVGGSIRQNICSNRR